MTKASPHHCLQVLVMGHSVKSTIDHDIVFLIEIWFPPPCQIYILSFRFKLLEVTNIQNRLDYLCMYI